MTVPDNPDMVSAMVMQTFVGEMFDVFNPDPGKIQVKDIAHSLSMICRYGGHTREFYSVAEHSVLMSRYFGERGEYDLARAALLHDATEAYMGDLIRPMKVRMPEYRTTEDILQQVIFLRFGLPPEIPLEVKQADLNIVVDEKAALLYDVPWGTVTDHMPPLGVDIRCWFPNRAEQEWFNTYWGLFG